MTIVDGVLFDLADFEAIDEYTVALVLDEHGGVVDHCGNWETAQNYALHEGYIVRAVRDDGDYWTIERQQALYDAERARFRDCYGLDAA